MLDRVRRGTNVPGKSMLVLATGGFAQARTLVPSIANSSRLISFSATSPVMLWVNRRLVLMLFRHSLLWIQMQNTTHRLGTLRSPI